MGIQFLVGVDGGGTSTRARIVARDGTLAGYGEAGASGLGQGIDHAWQHVLDAIGASFKSAGMAVPPPRACAVGLGMAGAHVRERCDAFLAAAPRFARVALDTDAYAALLGAHQGRPGVIVVAGTGSVGEVLRSDGSRLAVGGWGFPVGDEGSGAWLGLHAMRLAHQSIDARVPAGPLARAVFALAGETRERLLAWCEHAGQHEYAQLAPLVFEAEASDNAAKHLLDVAARALEALAVALDPQGQLPLAVVGSIAVRLAARFSPSMRNRCVAAQGDAAEGALHLIRAALQGAAQ